MTARRAAAVLAALAAMALAGCATTTTTAVWRDPELGAYRLSTVLVMGVSEDAIGRRLYEDALSAELRRHGVAATASYVLLPESGKLTREEIDAAIAHRGFHEVLVTDVIGTQRETVHVPPHYDYYHLPIYDNYYRYYAFAWDRVYDPGYTRTFTTVSLETSLYLAPSGRVAWGMRTRSVDPDDVERLVDELVRETVANLTASGLVP